MHTRLVRRLHSRLVGRIRREYLLILRKSVECERLNYKFSTASSSVNSTQNLTVRFCMSCLLNYKSCSIRELKDCF